MAKQKEWVQLDRVRPGNGPSRLNERSLQGHCMDETPGTKRLELPQRPDSLIKCPKTDLVT